MKQVMCLWIRDIFTDILSVSAVPSRSILVPDR